MKRIPILLAGFAMLLLMANVGYAWSPDDHVTHKHYRSSLDHVDIDFEGSTLIFTFEESHDAVVEITEDYQLYINGELIPTDDNQRKSLRRCYLLGERLVGEAVKIGIEGAHIGIEGAKVGLLGLGGVLKMLLTDYDQDDLERDMERHTRRLERKAAQLEKKASRIESIAEEFELSYLKLEEEIPQLAELD
ncbi:MAG: hypothetical protein ABIJ61_01465 [bacterium]